MFETDVDVIASMGAAARRVGVIALRLVAVGELYARRGGPVGRARDVVRRPVRGGRCRGVGRTEHQSAGPAPRSGTRVNCGNAFLKIAAIFATGDIDFRMVAAIINRTSNVDDAAIGDVDAALPGSPRNG